VLFHVLGPLEVHATSGTRLGGGKPAAVLAALLLRPGTWVGADRLVRAAWPGRVPPASAEANLRTYVWHLRRLLPGHDGGPRIERAAEAYRIRVAPGELDSARAAELRDAARTAACDADRPALLREALELWRGRPFEGVEVDPAELTELEELHLSLREDLGRAQLALGRGADAVATLRAVTADAPLRESAWALLVRALDAAGMRAEALLAYRRAAGALATELGVEPGPALTEARQAVHGGVRRELPRDIRLTGRDDELARLAEPVPVTIVDGMPGAGKTALVVHAAHRLCPAFPDGQLFVSLAGHAPVTERLLRGIGMTDVPADPGEQAALWRSEIAGRRMLIVLDDARGAAQVLPLLPASSGSRTFITTTRRGWHLDGAQRLDLRPLGAKAAAALFAAAAGPRGADPWSAAAVLRACDGLPAALVDAAARLVTRPHWPVQRLAEEIADDPCRVFSGAVRQSIGAVLATLNLPERSAWRALAGLPAEFRAPAGSRAAWEALADRGLLESAGPDRYRSHALVRHVAGCRRAWTPRRAAR